MIPPSIIEQIRLKQSIFDLISIDVELKQSGSRFSGLCPFHSEKSPSFFVNDEEGFYHCFGCGVHGDIFSYLMEQKSYSFMDAVKYLASKTGVSLPAASSETYNFDDGRKKRKIEFRELMRIVQNVFHSELKNSPKALDYLKRRSISEKSIEAFSLGVSPSAWSFLFEKVKERLKSANIKKTDKELTDSLLKLGLIKLSKKQTSSSDPSLKIENLQHYDSFRGRIIFPISLSDAQPIAFGGRLYGEESKNSSAPKYLNSPENELYNKSQTFYGMAQSIKHIRASRHVYLVEGYLDVIRMHEAGIQNSLAACGTALNESHAAVLKKIINKVTLVFDGDSAGLKAAASSFRSFSGAGFETEVCMLERGEDPDSFLQKIDSKKFSSEKDVQANESALKDIFESYVLKNSLPLLDFFIGHQLLGEDFKFEDGKVLEIEKVSAAKRGKLSSELSAILAKTANLVERDILANKAAKILNVSADSFKGLVSQSIEKQAFRNKLVKKASSGDFKTNKVLSREKPVVTIFEKQVISAVLLKPAISSDFLETYQNIENKEDFTFSSELLRLGRFFNCLEISLSSLGKAEYLTEATILDSAIKSGYQREIVEEIKQNSFLEAMNPEAILKKAPEVFSRLAVKAQQVSLNKEGKSGGEGAALAVLQKKLALKQKQLKA